MLRIDKPLVGIFFPGVFEQSGVGENDCGGGADYIRFFDLPSSFQIVPQFRMVHADPKTLRIFQAWATVNLCVPPQFLLEQVRPPSVAPWQNRICRRAYGFGELHKFPVVRVGVKSMGEPDLTHVAEAGSGMRLGLGFAQGRQQHASENRDDGDDHQ